jgi:ADP-ribose pyrophosphatase YjhB (NUDIX family)
MPRAEDTVPVTVDVIVEPHGDGIVLVRRKNAPEGFALPGGFVKPGESLAEAAVREVKEQTGLQIVLGQQFYTYSRPGRDPRGPAVSVVFTAEYMIKDQKPIGADDTAYCIVAEQDNLPEEMAFDHREILIDYVEWKKTGRRPRPIR